jgi:signal transduction histidine kinase
LDIPYVFRLRIIKTASFRLAAAYVALFTISAVLLGATVYLSLRYRILADFDERMTEETDALRRVFVEKGREKLAAIIQARGAGGGSLEYGLESPEGKLLAGEIVVPVGNPEREHGGWTKLLEADTDEEPEEVPEIVRTLVSRMPDGSLLVVGDEQHRSDDVLSMILWAFGVAIGATVAVGTIGGLWFSSQALRRVDSVKATAQGIAAGDLSRRISGASVDDELSSLAGTLNRMFDRVEELLLANKHAASTIAHDLRKPLVNLLRRLQAIRAEGAADQTEIEAAIDEVGLVLETFNALLRMGQIEAGARRAGFRPLDLAVIARDVVETFSPAAQEEGKDLISRLDTPLPVRGDKELLAQMIANILDNALQHTPAGVRIEVSGEQTQNGVALWVADNGHGVATHEMKSIFQRYYRTDAARKSRGTGLGLSLVAAIAELHGFECSATDNQPGLRMTLTVPNNDNSSRSHGSHWRRDVLLAP